MTADPMDVLRSAVPDGAGPDRMLPAEAMWFDSEESRQKLAPRLGSLAFGFGEGTPGRAWATGNVIWIADMLEESMVRRSELAAAAGLHSVVATPLLDADRVTGVLELFTHSIRPINEPTRMSHECKPPGHTAQMTPRATPTSEKRMNEKTTFSPSSACTARL